MLIASSVVQFIRNCQATEKGVASLLLPNQAVNEKQLRVNTFRPLNLEK